MENHQKADADCMAGSLCQINLNGAAFIVSPPRRASFRRYGNGGAPSISEKFYKLEYFAHIFSCFAKLLRNQLWRYSLVHQTGARGRSGAYITKRVIDELARKVT
jgi:hypothetical protein